MISIPITASTIKGTVKDIRQVKNADLIELRLDYIKDIAPEKLERLLLENNKKKIIVTDRKKRLNLINRAIDLKTDFVDLDISIGVEVIKEILNKKKSTKVIISFHDFKKTDKKEVIQKYNRIKKINPDIIKIATFANDISDNLIIFDLIRRARKDNRKIIALCMGERGQISRILSTIFGAELTFGSLEKGKESAPGQLTAGTLRNIFRINKLKNPKIFGLVGNPVRQSKGFLIHNKAFKKLKLESIYINFLVDDLASFIRDYKPMIAGLSITIPFKREIIKCIDRVSPMAGRIGAVNTVIKKNGKLIGYNTDVTGAIEAIKEKIDIRNKRVLLIGAGGVARAIAFGIKKEKGKLIILNRTLSKAKELADELNSRYAGLDEIKSIENVDILINGTSIGMFPDINKTPIKKDLLKKVTNKRSVVFDAVYNPVRTRLLKDAAVLGCKIISGNKMFLNQAAHQFKLFTGKKLNAVSC